MHGELDNLIFNWTTRIEGLIDGMSNTQQIDLTICQWQNEIRLLLLQSIKGQSLCTTPFLKEVTLIIQIVQYLM